MEGEEKQQLIQEIVEIKAEITRLVDGIRDTRTLCEKATAENQYLQEYVGTLTTSEVRK